MSLFPAAKPSESGEAGLTRQRGRRRWADTVVAAGVWSSATLTLAGLLLFLWSPPSEVMGALQAGARVGGLAGASARATAASGDPVWSARGAAPEALINLGLAVLMLTPVARLLALLVEFIREGDRTYAWITAGVLAVLGLGLLVGRAHA